MNRLFNTSFCVVLILTMCAGVATAQVTFSYSSPQVYTYGTAITSLSPTVTSGWYGTGSTFANVASADGCYYNAANGDIYATSTSTNNGYIYNSSGTLLFTQNGTTYNYSYPESIVADASGTTFVANNTNGTVKKLTTGGVETSISGFTNPIGLAFDSSGNLYVTDAGTGDVYKIASGATTASVFLTGFTSPWGIAIDASGDMFVSQPGSNNIIEVANAISGSTTKTTFATGFNSPRCLAFDAAGYLFVADCNNSAIKKISTGGTVTTVISSGLGTDVGVSIDASGDLYVSSYGNSKVYKFSPIAYSISPALPAGLSINSYTGIISGTPTACSPATTYTITGNNGTNSGTATVSITVNPTVPAGTGATVCGSGTATLTASSSTPSGGTYNWYAALTGGSSLGTGASFITSSITSTTTYYVAYTQNGATSTPRTAVTAAVSSSPVLATVPTAGAYLSYSFTGGTTTDQTGGGNNGTLQAAPTTTTDRFGVANNAYYFNGSSQFISTTTSYAAPGPQTFSISLWFRTSTAGGLLIDFGVSNTGPSHYKDRNIYMSDNGQLNFGLYSGGVNTLSTTATYADGNWHNVIVTVSNANGSSMYVDGALQASNAAMNTPQNFGAAAYWKIGWDSVTGWPYAPSDFYFTGSIDDVAVYNTELTPAQVYAAYGAGASTGYCAGNTLSLQANTVAGATYSWTGPNSFTSSSQNPTVTSNATAANMGTYTCTVTASGGCSSVITVKVPTDLLTYTWTGATNTDPTKAGNWSYASGSNLLDSVAYNLPRFDATSAITIPNSLTNYPVLTANETVYNLSIASGASLNLNGYTLSAECNIINSASTSGTTGILYGNNTSSGITWNGSTAAQSYTGTNTATTAELGNMTVNNSAAGTVTINSGPVDIFNTLTITSGNLVVGASPAALTLKSTASLTASVAAIPSAYSITGNVTVERFVTGGSTYSLGRWVYRNYRLMSSPVNEGIDGGGNYPCSLNYLGASTIITDCTSSYGSNYANPSLYLFNEKYTPSNATFISGNFIGVTNIANTAASGTISTTDATNSTAKIYVGDGYMMYFRGNNINNLTGTPSKTKYPYVAPENVTFSTTGALNQGTYSVVSWTGYGGLLYTTSNSGNAAVRGFNLVGNPYASSIDWSTFSSTSSSAAIYGANVNPTVYLFDPVTGNYDTYSATTHVATGNGSNIIASGQGFFVQSNNHSSSLTFNESAKTSTEVTGSKLLMGTPNSQTAYNSYLRLNLMTDSLNHTDMVVGLNTTSTPKFNGQEDAEFMGGSSQMQTIMAMTADSVKAAVKWIAPPKANDEAVVKLRVWAQNKGTYTIQRTDFKEIPAIYEVWLMDNLKKDSLDIRNNTNYVFDLDPSDTTTFGSNRFTVVIRQDPALAVHLLSFSASKTSGGSALVWLTENEQNYTDFTVQRSTDGGNTFATLSGIPSASQGTYSFLDTNPATGANLYRIMITDLNGAITYSNVITLSYNGTNNNTVNPITIYPNPAKTAVNLTIQPLTSPAVNVHSVNSTLSLTQAQSSTESYNVQVINNSGKVKTTSSTNSQNWQTDVSNLTPGVYIIEVTDNKTKALVGKGTFVKL